MWCSSEKIGGRALKLKQSCMARSIRYSWEPQDHFNHLCPPATACRHNNASQHCPLINQRDRNKLKKERMEDIKHLMFQILFLIIDMKYQLPDPPLNLSISSWTAVGLTPHCYGASLPDMFGLYPK